MHIAQIKTRGCGRSGADCRFRLFCSIRGQHVNPRPSVTVAGEIMRVNIKNIDDKIIHVSMCRVGEKNYLIPAALKIN